MSRWASVAGEAARSAATLAVTLAVTFLAAVTPASAQADAGGAASRLQQGSPPRPSREAEPQRQGDPSRQAGPERQAEPRRQGEDRQANRPQAEQRRTESRRGGHDNKPTHPPKKSDHWPDNGRNLSPFLRSGNNDSRDLPSLTPRPGQDAFRATPRTYAPRGGSGRRDRGHSNGNLYLGYPYLAPLGYGPYFPTALPETAETPGIVTRGDAPREAEGFLRLRVQPRSADVYVDGAFAGVVDDFGGAGERVLPAGTHRVEIVAPGFERVTFDVRVPANDTITFTRDLDRLDDRPQPPAAPPVAIPHKTMYIIPNCYAGDTLPRATDLRPGCSLANLRTIP
jgi:hypothetical protein